MSFRMVCADCEWTREEDELEDVLRWGNLHENAENHRVRVAIPEVPHPEKNDHA